MRRSALLLVSILLGTAAGPLGAEPMPAEYFTELGAWVDRVGEEISTRTDAAAKVARFEAAWNERGDYEARARLLDLAPRLRGPVLEKFLIARLGDESNAAVRRVLALAMGELAAESFREPLAKACREDPVTFDFAGGCIATQGHARDEACKALEHLEERMGDHLEGDEGWMGEDRPE